MRITTRRPSCLFTQRALLKKCHGRPRAAGETARKLADRFSGLPGINGMPRIASPFKGFSVPRLRPLEVRKACGGLNVLQRSLQSAAAVLTCAVMLPLLIIWRGVRMAFFLPPAGSGGRWAVAEPAGKALPESVVSVRTSSVCSVLVLFAVGIVWRLFELQGVEHGKWAELAGRQHETSLEIKGARGTIRDSAGRVLAVSVQSASIALHPAKLDLSSPEDSRIAAELPGMLGITPAEFEVKRLSKKPFVWLARDVPHDVGAELKSKRHPAISVFDDFRRFYPQEALAGPVLGRISRDGKGQSGLELYFNNLLEAPEMALSVRRDAKGRYLRTPIELSAPADEGGYLSPFARILQISERRASADLKALELRREGLDLVLSIDSYLQSILETEFEQGRKNAQAKQVFGLLMDADSGEVLALGQSGSFNPNAKSEVSPDDLRNSVLQDSFEPGSTMKPLVAAAALDAGVVGANEVMDCEDGRYRVGPHWVRDVHPLGKATFGDVLVRSSNICMAKLGQRLGRDRLHAALTRFGFGRQTGLELPGEAKGILRGVDRWKEIDIATHSFGQGVSVTAVQLVRAYAALANGGLLVEPTLLKRPKASGSTAAVSERVLSERAARTVGQILRGVTEDEHGTGRKARIQGVTVYGKTGTAQKARRDGRGYDPDRVLASFIGFADGSEIGVDRRLVMLVVVDEPGVRPRWGGTLAGPVFRRSMERVLTHLLANESPGIRTASYRGTQPAAPKAS